MQDSAENFRFSRKQEQAFIELLNPFNKSKGDIARKLKISERVLYNWLKIPQFIDRVKEERRKLVKQAFEDINSLTIKASKGLEELLNSGTENVRLRACQTVLNYNLKILEYQELQERITILEETLDKGRYDK